MALHLMYSLPPARSAFRSGSDVTLLICSVLLLLSPPPRQVLPSQFYLSIDLFLSHSLTRLLPFIISRIKPGSPSILATRCSLCPPPHLRPLRPVCWVPTFLSAPPLPCIELKQGQRPENPLNESDPELSK